MKTLMIVVASKYGPPIPQEHGPPIIGGMYVSSEIIRTPSIARIRVELLKQEVVSLAGFAGDYWFSEDQ